MRFSIYFWVSEPSGGVPIFHTIQDGDNSAQALCRAVFALQNANWVGPIGHVTVEVLK